VPSPGCLRQQLRVAQAAAFRASPGGCGTHYAHPRDPSIFARHLTPCARVSLAPSNANYSAVVTSKTQIEARMEIFEFIEGWYQLEVEC
jgi:hypothetical protein